MKSKNCLLLHTKDEPFYKEEFKRCYFETSLQEVANKHCNKSELHEGKLQSKRYLDVRNHIQKCDIYCSVNDEIKSLDESLEMRCAGWKSPN